ncbi:MAG: hypothetical protein HY460_00405 [Parcubacteria group bacterium]|nr:hypothetical protein [Parcubacteria group bacterium]
MGTVLKGLLAFLTILCVAAGVYVVFFSENSIFSPRKAYESDVLGLAFQYPDDYILLERDLSTGMRLHHQITLTQARDLPPPENGEGPPTITIDIYQNSLDSYTVSDLIHGGNFTNFKLSPDGVTATTTVDGMPALSFRWSGLYEGETVVTAQPKWAYAFSVTYISPDDQIVRDFERLLQRIHFRKKS